MSAMNKEYNTMNDGESSCNNTNCDAVVGMTEMPLGTAGLIRRYMQIQQEIAALEKEREQLRDSLVNGLEGKVPEKWNSLIDGKTVLVVHRRKITVHYDERLLRDRLGGRYAEILEIDGTKIRKNRELVRPFLAPVLDRIGTPAAARVEAAIHSGSLPVEVFKGAFHKEVTPYISIGEVVERSVPSAADDPF